MSDRTMVDSDALADDLVEIFAESGDMNEGSGLLLNVPNMVDEGFSEDEIRSAIVHVATDDNTEQAILEASVPPHARVVARAMIEDIVQARADEIQHMADLYHVPTKTVEYCLAKEQSDADLRKAVEHVLRS